MIPCHPHLCFQPIYSEQGGSISKSFVKLPMVTSELEVVESDQRSLAYNNGP